MEDIILRLSGEVVGIFQADEQFAVHYLDVNLVVVLKGNVIEGNIRRVGVKALVVMLIASRTDFFLFVSMLPTVSCMPFRE